MEGQARACACACGGDCPRQSSHASFNNVISRQAILIAMCVVASVLA